MYGEHSQEVYEQMRVHWAMNAMRTMCDYTTLATKEVGGTQATGYESTVKLYDFVAVMSTSRS